MKTREQIRMKFWGAVYRSSVFSSVNPDCAKAADEALAEFDKRFPAETTSKAAETPPHLQNIILTGQSDALPEGVPPLPEGAVYLGAGDRFKVLPDKNLFHGWSFDTDYDTQWDLNMWAGYSRNAHYAAPSGSEVAKLNGK